MVNGRPSFEKFERSGRLRMSRVDPFVINVTDGDIVFEEMLRVSWKLLKVVGFINWEKTWLAFGITTLAKMSRDILVCL